MADLELQNGVCAVWEREVMDLLYDLHAVEQKQGRMITRKELHSHFPEDMSYADRRKMIQAWQGSYFERFRNIIRCNVAVTVNGRNAEPPK